MAQVFSSPRKKWSAAERQAHIRDLLTSRETVRITEMAEFFQVSEMTVRRDLDALEETQELRRFHGGAVPAERLTFEFDMRERRQRERAAKQAIAREALQLVEPGQRLILDNGTTALELATLLRERENLTVITPSLAVVSELLFTEAVEVILLGGVVRQGSPDLTGSLTEHCLDLFEADVLFQGMDAIGEDGALYNADLRLAEVDKKMRRHAAMKVVLADSTKIGRTALVRNGYVNETDLLISDSRLSKPLRKKLTKVGANLRLAKIM